MTEGSLFKTEQRSEVTSRSSTAGERIKAAPFTQFYTCMFEFQAFYNHTLIQINNQCFLLPANTFRISLISYTLFFEVQYLSKCTSLVLVRERLRRFEKLKTYFNPRHRAHWPLPLL